MFRNTVSETGFSLHLQVKPTQLGAIDRASPYLRTPVPAPRRGIQAKQAAIKQTFHNFLFVHNVVTMFLFSLTNMASRNVFFSRGCKDRQLILTQSNCGSGIVLASDKWNNEGSMLHSAHLNNNEISFCKHFLDVATMAICTRHVFTIMSGRHEGHADVISHRVLLKRPNKFNLYTSSGNLWPNALMDLYSCSDGYNSK
jgi:hypothetical protein